MQNSSAFQYLAIDTIHESTTNPRRTFDEAKLQELADYVPSHIIGVLFPGRFVAEAAKSRMVEGGARSEEHIMDEPDPNPTLTAVAEWGQRKKHWLTARSLRRLQLEATRIDRKCHNVIGGNLRGRSISG